MPRGILALFLTVTLLATAISCDNNFGILASIQKEIKQTGTDIFLAATVKTVVDDGDVYFAQMAKLYSRKLVDTVGTDAWKVLAVKTDTGSTISDYACTALAAGTWSASRAVFAVLSERIDNELIGLFATTDGGTVWTNLPQGGIPAGGYIQSLFYVHDTLFASIRRKQSGADVYDLLYHDGSGFVTSGADVTGLETPFIGGVWDGTCYRFAVADGIFAGTTPATIATDTPVDLDDTTAAGICADRTTDDVYVSTTDGHVLKRLAIDGTWSRKQIPSKTTLGNLAVIPASTAPGGPGIRLAIARYDDTYGYLEFDWENLTEYMGENGELASSESNYSTTLSGKPVLSFYRSTAENRMFVTGIASNLTGYGLYSNFRDDVTSTFGGWMAE